VFTGTGGDGVQFLSPCWPLLDTRPRSRSWSQDFFRKLLMTTLEADEEIDGFVPYHIFILPFCLA